LPNQAATEAARQTAAMIDGSGLRSALAQKYHSFELSGAQ